MVHKCHRCSNELRPLPELSEPSVSVAVHACWPDLFQDHICHLFIELLSLDFIERALNIRCQALSSCSDPLPHFGPLSSLLSCPLSFHCLQTCSPDCEHLLGTLCVHPSRAFPDTHFLCDFSFHHLPLSGCPVLFLHSSDHTLSLLSAFLFVFFVLFVYWIHCCLFSNLSALRR